MGICTEDKGFITRQSGFSIIELMIAMALGLLVLFAVLQVFTASLQSVNLQNDFSRVQENARMATQMLSRDIRGAGYWGCDRNTDINILLDTDDEDYDASLLPIGMATVAGEDDVAEDTTIAGVTAKAGSDTLTLRGAQSFSEVKLDPDKKMNTTAADIHIIKYSDKEEVIKKGDILLIGDCEAADLFTNMKDKPFDSGNIQHGTGNPGDGFVYNKTKNLTKAYGLSAQILAPYAKTYFIGENLAGGYSLYRSENGEDGDELVRGISDLQLVYGEDGLEADDGSLDIDNVSSIRVTLVSENGSLEKNYSFTVNIRNRSL